MEKARVTRLDPLPPLEGGERRAHSARQRRIRRNVSRSLATGELIGKHRILKRLGRGSMGDVYLCEHIDLPELRVALKVLAPTHGSTPELRTRFRNEIAASARVNDRQVIRPYEFIQNGELLAYTMEYVDGGDLADWMNANPSFVTRKALELLVQVCAGVKAIHAAGIVHRDLKPQNLLVTSQGEIRIGDFAVSRTNDFERLTAHGKMVGTIDYISPQYLEHGSVTPGCDIYAIGAIAFEIFARRPPFVADGIYETLSLKLRGEAERVDHVNPSCPKSVADVIQKALQRDASLRFQNADECIEALNRVLASPEAHQIVHTSHDSPPQTESTEHLPPGVIECAPEDHTPVQYLPVLMESTPSISRPPLATKSRFSSPKLKRIVRTVGVGAMLGAALIVVVTTYLTIQQRAVDSSLPSLTPATLSVQPNDTNSTPPFSNRQAIRIAVQFVHVSATLIDTLHASRRTPETIVSMVKLPTRLSKSASSRKTPGQTLRPRWAVVP
jgi:serine/threonine protein kinase